MIAHVYGTVVEKFAGTLIIDVQGIGYELSVPVDDYETAALNDQHKFYTYHHVREQAEELFGLSTLAAKKLFELLITVQGIGPKAALAILSLGSAEVVRNAIANADAKFLSGASGVGKKTAERVTVDISDKVGLPTYYIQDSGTQVDLNTNDDALEALIALGYTLADATKALEQVDGNLPINQRITQALRVA